MAGTERLFEQALGIAAPWAVKEVRFDAAARRLTISRRNAPSRPPPGSFLAGITSPAPGSYLIGKE
jgi:hypothetical protein